MVGDKLKKCKHLVKLRSGKTLCRKWNERNTKIRKGVYLVIDMVKINGKGTKKPIVCLPHSHYKHNYKGCPFNREEWEYAEWSKPDEK